MKAVCLVVQNENKPLQLHFGCNRQIGAVALGRQSPLARRNMPISCDTKMLGTAFILFEILLFDVKI